MANEDSTVRLPDKAPGAGSAGGELPDRGFGLEPARYEPNTPVSNGGFPGFEPLYSPAAVAPYGAEPPLYQPPGPPAPPPRPAAPPNDRLLVHLIWEVMLLALVAGLAVYARFTQPAMFSRTGLSALLITGALFGLLAIALSLSMRAGVPNLAVGAVASVSGVLFTKQYGSGVLVAAALAIGVALMTGLVLGIVVGLLHVPSWAASLGVVAGGYALVAGLGRGGRSMVLSGHPYDPGRQALLWFIGFAVVSVLAGFIGLFRGVRRGVGSFRPAADPAERRGPGAALVAVLALLFSSGLAGAVGVLQALHLRAVAPTGELGSTTLIVLGAVLVGGVSAYGRRGGVLGTLLGVSAVSLVIVLGTLKDWNTTVVAYTTAAGAILLGLIVTRLVEWGGRPRPRPEPATAAQPGPAFGSPVPDYNSNPTPGFS